MGFICQVFFFLQGFKLNFQNPEFLLFQTFPSGKPFQFLIELSKPLPVIFDQCKESPYFSIQGLNFRSVFGKLFLKSSCVSKHFFALAVSFQGCFLPALQSFYIWKELSHLSLK